MSKNNSTEEIHLKLLPQKLLNHLSVKMSIESLVLLTSLYFAIVINFPFITRMHELADPAHVIFSLTPFAALTGAFLVIFTLFSFKYIFKPVIIFILLSSASATYAMMKYNVLFDYSMVENIFQTNIAEANSYINLRSFLYLFFLAFIPALFIALVEIKWTDSWLKGLLHRTGMIVIGFAILGIIAAFFYKDYASVGRNNHYLNKMILPTHLYYAGRYINNTYFVKPLAFKVMGEDAKIIKSDNNKPTLMVLVVGETARSENIAYNGYERNTNPYTENLAIISFQNVSSCGTATAHSLPCMFSSLTHKNYDHKKVNAQSNVLDIMQHAGIDVIWYENDGGHKNVAQRINKEEVSTSSANPFVMAVSVSMKC
ncbi:phosphoethanolamine transferase [Psychromonas sp. MME1]|uniref:phosphoethanolamine transferase n=1 Tax=Psychromonas sp. MME1 TaxID=3231032 RepID=UPI0034E26C07